jgi:aminopeptidase
MTDREFYERYAAVVMAVGLNIQEGQELYIRAPVQAAEAVPPFVTAAYDRGAKYVHVEYRDQAINRTRLEHARQGTLEYVPPGAIAERLRVAREGGASLAMLGDDPTALSGIDSSRKGAWTRALAQASSEYRELAMRDAFPWCVISMPNEVWARAVYPDLEAEEASARLIDAVARVCRLDSEDPVASWVEHSRRLKRIAGWLDEQAFDRFHYLAPGTDLVVGLPDQHRWIATESESENGIRFIANIPTDEIFSAPDYRRVNGTVRSTRPLVLNGTDVGVADFVVEDGKIRGARSERDQAVLEEELNLDEGARYFGELALVSEDAPIAKLNTVFYDGLYDENAGCHLAFGNAYAHCLRGGAEMSSDALAAAGLNRSQQHHDFTVGSADLSIIAYRADGSSVEIMRGGRWTEAVPVEPPEPT